VSKNWPNDSKIECKPPSNLMESILTDLSFKKELEKIEDSFEWDEVVDI